MDTALGLPALIALIAVALLFDFLNGLHDAANSIATVVSTRVLRPRYAVAWAAFFNFIAFMVFGLHVAQTIGTGIVAAEVIDVAVIFGALVGAIAWNLSPGGWVSLRSSHALIGGLAGAGIIKAGPAAVVWSGLGNTRPAIVLSPSARLVPGPDADAGGIVGFRALDPWPWTILFGYCSSSRPRSTPSGMAATTPRKRWESSPSCCTRRAPWGTISYPALGDLELSGRHGAGHPVRRLAHRSHHGIEDHASASSSRLLCGDRGAATLFLATCFGIPVSTTHTITGAIVGVGAARKVARSAGTWPAHGGRLGPHDAGSRADRRGLLSALQAVALSCREVALESGLPYLMSPQKRATRVYSISAADPPVAKEPVSTYWL